MKAPHWQPLALELDQWSAAGRKIDLWLRDDDAVAPSPALDRLSELAERLAAPILLAVIPLLAEPALAAALRDMPLLRPCQHGATHRNHAPAGSKKSEFGAEREAADVDAEIAQGRRRLHDLLGDALLPIFVPPWNRIAQSHAARLGELGFAGLSCFRGYRLGPDGGPRLLNTHVDVMDWRGGRVGRPVTDILAELVVLLAQQRQDEAGDIELGLLLHHRDHDDTAWSALSDILGAATAHPAIRSIDPGQLVVPPGAISNGVSGLR
ncbi:polysaccharide deacetylase family protein [Bosea sp. ANAM02]|uniref:polysaccharide deacetylase family protein n=1 Tax=Bosea sp. ANAM02 TaxID=2020412 RepID=UPI00140EAFD3|nr:polysaccharide deacetylase family protein [Bosea sp. ANAM02]BCB18275.1 polysaccharide deacetylase [Bosea sp. ANAM02]